MEAKAGFAISLVAGIIILIADMIAYVWPEALGWLGLVWEALAEIAPFFSNLLFGLGLLWAILVLVGAVLIASGRTTAGGVLVILFSLLSLFSLSIGGLIIGLILGIVGGALGIAKK